MKSYKYTNENQKYSINCGCLQGYVKCRLLTGAPQAPPLLGVGGGGGGVSTNLNI